MHLRRLVSGWDARRHSAALKPHLFLCVQCRLVRCAEQSAAVVGYECDGANQCTRTARLGSVCIDGSPGQLEQALRVLTGEVLNGKPVQATTVNLKVVRDQFERHRPYHRCQLAPQKEEDEARRVREEHER